MCMIDYDPASVYSSGVRTARKVHKCVECSRDILPGEKYSNAFGVWEGYASTFKTCVHCGVGQDWLQHNCNGFQHGGLSEELDEHAEEYRAIRFGMLRLRVGMRRRWKRFDGSGLMPLQPMPPEILEHTL